MVDYTIGDTEVFRILIEFQEFFGEGPGYSQGYFIFILWKLLTRR